MANLRVKMNPRGVRELLKDRGVVGELETVAGPVLASAVSSAPVDTGAYARSLAVAVVETSTHTEVRIGSDLRYAPFVQAATGNLSRALDASGASV